jgi:chemotaxis signal transduction protein
MAAIEAAREAQLFCFTVPSFSKHVLALSMPEVLEVARIDHVASVPFAPRFVIGLALWRGEMVAVIDLAAALMGNFASADVEYDQHLIMQVTINGKTHPIAWPILDGSKPRMVPTLAVRAELPSNIVSHAARACIRLDQDNVTIVDAAGLFL